ncbi:3'-5' exonuclease, putative [Ricinus communis]|uniref:3'-5' exonuclease, putative n=1 Tax=Ricinus communis TaxID=3988 RepID=B9SI83_RICCO|nr:3'-5' exonuclease, putative [Ricinus communis]
MSQDAMNIDQTAIQTQSKSQTTTGSLSSSLSNLSGSSRTIPSNKDFHFYYNFDEFKLPIQQIARRSQSLLESIGSSNNGLFKDKNLPYPNDPDNDDDTYWNVLMRLSMNLRVFKRNKRKKKKKGLVSSVSGSPSGGSVSESGVKVADLKAKGVKAKVPFHIPTIKKPQEEYNILVNNSNQPFEHVWLQRSEDGLRFIHPLEKLSILDFVDKSIGNAEPVSPPSLECTPFKLVKEVKDLKELAAKLRAVNEFAVDLEHNQYRSFQGLTCLMQISTRTEDFIIDTLKLRIHVGPYLREVFKDPTKRKVMHGADRDIIWLQRDFGIYVCNLFDTGQASRVLKLERNSLEHLLRHFCGITANKEYQNADWRLRPLTDEMLRYGREDTHYLLYIYDLMRIMLLSMPNETENSNSPLAEVYKRSYDVCMQLYEKELLTESSYLHIYGLQTAGFNAQQLAIVAGLCEWRDVIARTEDESTGFILPNKTLLEIAKQMPVTPQKLRRALKSKHPYIERNLGSVVNVVRHAMQNAAEFEAAAQRLKEGCIETDNLSSIFAFFMKASQDNVEVNDDMDMDTNLETAEAGTETICDGSAVEGSENALQTDSPQLKKEPLKAALAIDATVQVLKKPAGAFGALLGKSSAGKRRFDMAKKDKDEIKLDKIRSSVSLPFHSFLGRKEPAKPAAEEPNLVTETPRPEESFAVPATGSSLEDIILLGDNSDVVVQENVDSDTKDVSKSVGCESETDEEGEPASLSDLSTSFQKCFQSNNENKTNENNMQKSQDPTGLLQLKPFDYAAARKEVIFGEESKAASGGKDQSRNDGVKDRRKNSVGGGVEKDDGTRDFPQGKRRQAFPATGNRSATFR